MGRSSVPWGPLSGNSWLAASLIVVAAYAVVGALTLTVGQYAGLASPVWPAAGLAFAVVYEWGYRMAPAILVGSVLSNAFTLVRQDSLTTSAFIVTVAIGLGAATQAIVGAGLVTRVLGRRASLTEGLQIVAFLLLAGPVASVVNASVATIAQLGAGLLSADQVVRVWVTWWAGDAIGVVIFAPFVLMLLPGQSEVWSGRRWRVALPSLVGLILFVGFFVQADVQARQERELLLQQLAGEAQSELEQSMARHQEVLEGLASFIESSEEVTADEFVTYTVGALDRYPNLQALSWDPIVAGQDIAEFEAYQRDQQGLGSFAITERDAEGNLVPVSPRDEHVVVGLIAPLAGNEAALGFDINSNPVRRDAIDRARSSGEAAATGPVELVQESQAQAGMLALVPVYESGDSAGGGLAEGGIEEGGLRGFAVGVYRLGDLLADTYGGAKWNEVEVRLVDATEAGGEEAVALRPAVLPATIDLTTAADKAMASQEFSVYDRTWKLEVVPTSGPLATPNFALVPQIEVAGLILLTLLQAFVLLVTGLERTAMRQAQHADQEANTDELTGLHNRRSFLRNLALVRERSTKEGSHDVLLYLDLDRFKAVNDQAGHEAGDHMLQEVARVLSENVRSRDTVARIGGDEFAIILNNCEFERGREIADTLAEGVSSLVIDSDAGALAVGVSIGVVPVVPGDGRDLDELIRLADDACYEAKSGGGGVRSNGVSGQA